MSIENNNYNNFEDIPYLNNLESYNYYLKNAVIDLSNEETYDSLHKINKESNIYFDKGPPKSEPGVDDSSLNILLFDDFRVFCHFGIFPKVVPRAYKSRGEDFDLFILPNIL